MASMLAAGAVAMFGATPVDAVACTLEQVTFLTSQGARAPSISDDGNWVAFVTDSDDIGINPDTNDEIFLYDVDPAVFHRVRRLHQEPQHDAAADDDGRVPRHDLSRLYRVEDSEEEGGDHGTFTGDPVEKVGHVGLLVGVGCGV